MPPDPDDGLITRLPVGDEQAFVALVTRHQASMLRLAATRGSAASRWGELLGISEGNRRVLLHRGRSRLRQIVEDEFGRVP